MFQLSRPARVIGPAIVGAALMVWTGGSAMAATTLLQLSADPYTNSLSQHATELEPDTFSFGSTIVAAFQVGRFFGGGASNIGFATSQDGGSTWTHGFLPDTTPFSTPASSVYQRSSDASVAFDSIHGVWLISFLGLFPNGTSTVDVLASRSTDGGLTWSVPVVVNHMNQFDDKNWTVCDNNATSPFKGHCYTEFDDNTRGDLEQMTTSTDGGLTWSVAKATTDNVHGIGGQPLVEPNGTVVVPFDGFSFSQFLVEDFVSTNGGVTWGPGRVISIDRYHRPAGGIRAGIPLPSAEIDGAGKIYLAWPDCRFEVNCSANDPVFSTTTNGVMWTPVTRIPADPKGSGVDHFIFGLGVDRMTSGTGGHVALTFYFYPNANCTSSTCALKAGSTTSADGGVSWTATSVLAGPMSLSLLPNTSQGRMVGDYTSTSFSSTGAAFPGLAVAFTPTTEQFNENMYTILGGLTVGAGIAATEQSGVSASATSTSSTVTEQ
jgi:hypothetical protein